ncbi:MAG TPA: hemolysin family protein [Caulobacteraceae bacterium]|nr:hemolysin family protein [Caulobacteraceae bacterium]
MILFASLVVLFLILLNGLFSMSELAVVSSRRARLQSRADRGDRGAAAALALSENPTRFMSAVQVGITLIGILAGAYGQATIAGELTAMLKGVPAIAAWADSIATGIVVVVLTYLSLVLGELAPKRFAMLFPETIASAVARPLSLMARVLHPFVALLTASTAGILRLLGAKDSKGDSITQEEVETVLAEGAHAGLIEPEEQAIIGEVMRLGDRPVRAAMTPRKEVYWISLDDDEAQQRAEIRACPYSRIVVAGGGDVDEPIGVVHKKDLLDALLDDQPLDVRARMTQPTFIPETTTLLAALDVFKKTPNHIALVVNEYGTLEGVVTPTDLLEMIAGDFPEAHDTTDATLLQRPDGSWLVDGRADLDDLHAKLNVHIEDSSGFHTAAGLVLDHLGRFPAEGETLELCGYRIEIVDMDERRIDKLLFTPLKPATPGH